MFHVSSDLTLKNGEKACTYGPMEAYKPGKRIEFDWDNGAYDDDIDNHSAFGVITEVKLIFHADKPAEVYYDVKMDNGNLYTNLRSYAVRGFADKKR